eukprot:jgi/Astpho2/4997/Aster-05935
MASYGRLPLQLPRGGQMCAYPRLHAHRGCPALRYMPQRAEGTSWPAVNACLMSCRSRSCSVKINVQAKALSSFDFFDREREQSLLLAQLKRPPEGVLVIVGPRSSGKSRLLEEVLVGKKKHKALLAFVDGRDQKLTNGGIMAEALKEQGRQQLPEVRRMLEQFIQTTGKVAEAVAKTEILRMIKSNFDIKSLALLPGSVLKTFEEPTPSSLNDVIKAYDSLLRLSSTRVSTSSPLPVICIDEANVLMGWYKGGAAMEDDLDALLRFLVKVSKQTHRAHVILATSEYSFVTWLTEKLDGPFFETQVVGDFPEPEARLFLEHVLGASVTDAEWAEIFEVCGGNAGNLRRASGHFRDLKDWTQALQEVWHNPMEDVKAGLRGRPGWSAAQYTTVLQRLVQTPYGAIDADTLFTQLPPDKRAAEMAVQAMVQANLLSYRPPSGWAQDIPKEAFGPDRVAVVTAPSAAYLYCMRRLQRRGALNSTAEVNATFSPPPAASESSTLQQQLKDGVKKTNSGTEAASITQTAAPEPSPLDQQIKNMEGKISMLETEEEKLLSTKPDGWQQERAYLREEKKQLREKEKQLREEKILLLRKSDT